MKFMRQVADNTQPKSSSKAPTSHLATRTALLRIKCKTSLISDQNKITGENRDETRVYKIY